MNYNYLTKNCVWSQEKLLAYGFAKHGDVFCYKKDLLNGLVVEINVAENIFEVDVFDSIFQDRYQPFYSGHGGGAIKSEVREILEDVIAKCGTASDVKTEIVEYMRQKYGTVPEAPWDSPLDITFKTQKSNKWYAIILRIKEKSLGLPSDAPLDVMNVKLDPQEIVSLVDKVKYFPAYHMNKTYWMTARLDKNADVAELKTLIDKSYSIVEKD